ncbi:HDOD domain-containing protein [Acidithiobacillus sp. HP-6]|uniref:EAL and HDOD domain-containing protein n=1 Tax=unclassified Acidithiobacillus TaxID=2614800 RepID=UPI0018791AF9|nr:MULTISPECIES: HDOD domain-containing protein [unclassified Acidithiobacillus]MBE7562901.1 HDOD domain-containing protein [Acidithiobacillus sp. HP-6]MBE7568174.1 HDOD domain-containing protein [Acidithiobacillus sp. HP-2]
MSQNSQNSLPPEDDQELVARQAILGRQDEIIGYELFARNESSGPLEDPFLCSARVLIKTFSVYNLESLLGGKPAFINFTNSNFDEKSLELFPARQVIPEFTITEAPSREFLGHLLHLQKLGFRLALDRFEASPWHLALLKIVDFIKIDCFSNAPEQWEVRVRQIKNCKLPRQPAIVATRVETALLARRCFEAGVDYTQGFYYMEPEVVKGKALTSNQHTIFDLLNLLLEENPVCDIEEAFHRDPGLSYQLLRYLNSAGMTRGQEIESIRQALILLGRQPLQRWLTLLLFASKGTQKSSVLVMATTRAKFAEILREKSPVLDDQPAALHRSFLAGMLSLLDVYLKQPLADLLSELKISDEMRKALINHEGEDGAILTLIEAAEHGDLAIVKKIGQTLALTLAEITAASLESMNWSSSLK